MACLSGSRQDRQPETKVIGMDKPQHGINFWVKFDQMAHHRKILVFGGVYLIYCVGLFYFLPLWGQVFRAVGFVFILLGSLLWGLKRGMLIAALGVAIVAVLHKVMGIAFTGGVLGPFIALCLAGMIGYMRDLNLRLDKELRQEQAVKVELEKYRNNLEALVEERTRELSRLGTAIHQASEIVIILDPHGRIVYVNPAFESITSYPREEALGRNVNLLLSGERHPIFYHDLWDTVRKKGAWRGLITNSRRDGSPFQVETSIKQVTDAKGLVTNYVAVCRDISRETQLEQMLAQSQKLEAVGIMAGGIAHDFNNILAAILGYTELSIQMTLPDTEVQDHLGKILKACERARDLIKQILLFSRQDEFKPQPVRLRSVVEEALKLIRASLPATIEIAQHLDSEAVIMADAVRMHQVVLNLCTNAGHAMQDGKGLLSIGLHDVDRLPDAVRAQGAQSRGGYVALEVRDTGQGIPADIRDKIFDPFFTTKPKDKGSGMGLAVVHGIVKTHGGAIVVDSEVGQGTIVRVFIPSREGEADVERPTPDRLIGGGERILYVDDEKDLVDLGFRVLTGLGYRVDAFTDSETAFHFFQDHHDAIDLVITDLTMPRISGEMLGKKILAIAPRIPIIICTGYSENFTETRARAMGFKGYAFKPLVRAELAAMVRRVLDDGKCTS